MSRILEYEHARLAINNNPMFDKQLLCSCLFYFVNFSLPLASSVLSAAESGHSYDNEYEVKAPLSNLYMESSGAVRLSLCSYPARLGNIHAASIFVLVLFVYRE